MLTLHTEHIICTKLQALHYTSIKDAQIIFADTKIIILMSKIHVFAASFITVMHPWQPHFVMYARL